MDLPLNQVLFGNCLDVLKTLPDNAIDSIVCDPPYGLGTKQPTRDDIIAYLQGADSLGPLKKGRKHCANSILGTSVVPESNDSEAEAAEPPITFRVVVPQLSVVPTGVVQFDDQTTRKQEVHGVRPVGELDDVLVREFDLQIGQSTDDGQLGLWERQGFTGCVEVCGCFTQLSATTFRVLVRLRHDPLRQPKAPSEEVTFAGAEVRAVLSLDVRTRTGELLPADSTDPLDAGLLLTASKGVGAATGARRLLSALQVLLTRQVQLPTDRTVSFDVSVPAALLRRFHSSRTPQKDFMGKDWEIPPVSVWVQCLRVLKPGGHLLSFAGTRTFDIMSVGIRSAGFEDRDTVASMFGPSVLQWVYGAGFPKSLDIAKAIDKMAASSMAKEREIADHLRECREALGLTKAKVDEEVFGGTTRYAFVEGRNNEDGNFRIYLPTPEEWEKLKIVLKLDNRYDDYIRAAIPTREMRSRVDGGKAELLSEEDGSFGYQQGGVRWDGNRRVVRPSSDLAKKWQGWGTALKPAWEPILCFRKPTGQALARSVLEHGVGALNIEGCRVGTTEWTQEEWTAKGASRPTGEIYGTHKPSDTPVPVGRWPSNLALSHAAGCKELEGETWECVEGCPVKMLDGTDTASKFFPNFAPEASFFYTAKASRSDRNDGLDSGEMGTYEPGMLVIREECGEEEFQEVLEAFKGREAYTAETFPDQLSDKHVPNHVRKHFRQAKKGERGNVHVTVKPVALMRWLVRLVCPKGGIVLDPYTGSGTTLVAAAEEGMDFIGIELDSSYYKIASKRAAAVASKRQTKETEASIFDLMMTSDE